MTDLDGGEIARFGYFRLDAYEEPVTTEDQA